MKTRGKFDMVDENKLEEMEKYKLQACVIRKQSQDIKQKLKEHFNFEIEKYLTKFPNYYWGYVMQANILIILGEIQKANEVLNFLEEKINLLFLLYPSILFVVL